MKIATYQQNNPSNPDHQINFMMYSLYHNKDKIHSMNVRKASLTIFEEGKRKETHLSYIFYPFTAALR